MNGDKIRWGRWAWSLIILAILLSVVLLRPKFSTVSTALSTATVPPTATALPTTTAQPTTTPLPTITDLPTATDPPTSTNTPAPLPTPTATPTEAPCVCVGTGQAKEVRTLLLSEWGILRPAGLSYSLKRDQLATLAKADPNQSTPDSFTITFITPNEDLIGTVNLDFAPDNTINMTYDDTNDHLLLLNSQLAELALVTIGEDGIPDTSTLVNFNLNQLGFHRADGMDLDLARSRLFILDSGASQILSVKVGNEFDLDSRIDLSRFTTDDLRGIAVHPTNHNLFVMSPNESLLYELTGSGQFVNSYDLAALNLIDPSDLAFGHSADPADDPDTIHLFIADSDLPSVGLIDSGQQPEIRKPYRPLARLDGNGHVENQTRLASASTEPLFGRIIEVVLDPGDDVVSFAVIGDYGSGDMAEAAVAALVDSWNPDFVTTTGDNNYPDGEAASIDDNVGQYYSQFIGNYQGSHGPGSPTNRFWPSLGNHDWHTITCMDNTCTGAHFDYFTLPNNERYYEVDLGLIHLFVLDNNGDEPDGRSQDSRQADWLRDHLAASVACFNLVYSHFPAYSSGHHGSQAFMQWPLSTWGADALLSGHDHLYERLDVSGMPYFVNGAGGASLYDFENIDNLAPEATSAVRYNQNHGAMLVTASYAAIIYQFYNVDGILIDEYTTAKNCPAVPDAVTFNPSADAFVRENDPDTNYGSVTKLEIDKGPDENSYVRFTVTGVTGTVQNATLRVFATSGSSNGPAVYGIDNNWTETEISWNNRPAPTTDAIADVDAVLPNELVEFDVTGYVSGDGTYSFVFLSDSSDGITFSSREASSPPELVLTVTSAPTSPTSSP